MIEKYLNIRHSTRNLSDIEFDRLLPTLAQELEQVNFYHNYNDTQLHNDYKQLCKWTTSNDTISSTNRIGMKLCEHFFPNFYDIESANGTSFNKLWKKDNLEKILRWNRKSHSTPYLSELKRGIYFCCGLTKNTMYRPQMMKLACIKYKPDIVLDPCAGWGGRLLGATSYGAHYIAFEPNTTTYNNLNRLVDFLGIRNQVTLICDDARNMNSYDFPSPQLILTSPPYFDLEIYTHEPTQSVNNTLTYQEWADNFLKVIIQDSLARSKNLAISCWNVGKVKNRDMNIDVEKYHNMVGYSKTEVLSVHSSKRQSNQNSSKNQKSVDETITYKSA